MDRLDKLILEMIEFDKGDPRRIQHLFKVHQFARIIGVLEGLNSDQMEILEAAAIVHDIGIKIAREKHGDSNGKLQEVEGPPYAKEMLNKLGYKESVIDRVCFLVGHHHTYTNIEGIDYQILVEADFLVNLYDHNTDIDAIKKTCDNIFKTKSGIEICYKMFGLN